MWVGVTIPQYSQRLFRPQPRRFAVCNGVRDQPTASGLSRPSGRQRSAGSVSSRGMGRLCPTMPRDCSEEECARRVLEDRGHVGTEPSALLKNGSTSCRERVWTYAYISVCAVSLKKKT